MKLKFNKEILVNLTPVTDQELNQVYGGSDLYGGYGGTYNGCTYSGCYGH